MACRSGSGRMEERVFGSLQCGKIDHHSGHVPMSARAGLPQFSDLNNADLRKLWQTSTCQHWDTPGVAVYITASETTKHSFLHLYITTSTFT